MRPRKADTDAEPGSGFERQALDLAPVMICDGVGRITGWTSGMQRLSGFASSEALGRMASELLDVGYPIAREEILRDLARDGNWNGEVTYRRRDGRRLAVACDVTVLRDAAGTACGTAALNIDVTETKRAEAEGLLASIVDGSEDAIIGKTLQGIVTSWNAAAERTFGFAADEMLGQSLAVLFPPHLLGEEDAILERLSRGERVEHFETKRLRKDGTAIDVSLSVSPVRDAAGRIIGAAKIARDITEQKGVRAHLEELQAELLHVSRLNDMSQMAAGLAHELNQPLSAISNYVSGAQKLLALGELERAADGCRRAAEQVTRAGEVIRRMRDFVGRREVSRRPEDLAELIRDSIALLMLGSPGASLEIETHASHPGPSVMIDRVQVQQVVVNLARNALEAMEGHQTRKLSVDTRTTAEGDVEVAIADTGSGLDEKVRDRLFQPFTTTKETGMGVGLSLCRSIIEAHGGRIWAEDNPAGGTVFRFTLPAA